MFPAQLCPTTPASHSHFPEITLATILDASSDICHDTSKSWAYADHFCRHDKMTSSFAR